jgi:hypothetical protein
MFSCSVVVSVIDVGWLLRQFWDALKSHRECGLITSEESPDANISDAEAATFWDEPVPVGAPSLPTSLPATAVDDVFDNMD